MRTGIKKRKLLLLAIVCSYLGIQNTLLAQNSDENEYFPGIRSAILEYLNSQDAEQLEGMRKPYDKYLEFWQDRLTPEGMIGNHVSAVGPCELETLPLCSGADPANWSLEGPEEHAQQMGLVNEIHVAPFEQFYLCGPSMGGIWKRNNGDAGWHNVTDGLNLPIFKVNSFAADPYDPNHMWAATGGSNFIDQGGEHGVGILETFDGGDTWNVNSGFLCISNNFPVVVDLVVDPVMSISSSQVVLHAISDKMVYRSIDSGVTWESWDIIDPLTFNPTVVLGIHEDFYDLEVNAIGDVFVSTKGRYTFNCHVYRYVNPLGWTDLTPVLSTPLAHKIKFTTGTFGNMYILRDASNRQILSSADHGSTWSVLHNTLGDGVNPKMELEYSETLNKIYWGSGNFYEYNVSTSTQAFVSQGHVDVRDIFIDDSTSGNIVFTANDGGVSRLQHNSGSSYSFTNLNGNYLPISEFYGLGMHDLRPERYILGATHNHAFFHRPTIGWSFASIGDGNDAAILSSNPDIGYISGNHKIYRYNFATSGIADITSGSAGASDGLIGHLVETFDNYPTKVFYIKRSAPGAGFVNMYDQSTLSWSNKAIPDFSGAAAFAVAPSNAQTWYISNAIANSELDVTKKLKKSIDGGTNWIDLGSSAVYNSSGAYVAPLTNVMAWNRVSDIQVSPYNANKLWITLTGLFSTDEYMRVLYSEDGGLTWKDYSEGLPRFPCHALEYLNGSNDVLFVGSETGVYYRDKNMPQWKCFSEGMPMAIITDLDINHCTRELLASTYGRSLWKTPIPDAITELVINTDQTFAAGLTQVINTDIRILPGKTFTLKGTFEMGRDIKIIVERGARLVVDGGTITNSCDYLWEGIELWGTGTSPQLSASSALDPNQGTVRILNGGKIEYARNAIRTQREAGGNFTGGRIFADNAIFKDNRFDVEMLKYNYPNQSYFNQVDFITTAPLPDPGYAGLGTSTHVRLWDVHGVSFNQCLWSNSGTFDIPNRGTGISSLDADFTVSGNCLSYSSTTCVDSELAFFNLYKGIVFNDPGKDNRMTIEKCEFNKVIQGVYINGGNQCLAKENEFYNLNGFVALGATNYDSWGVYAESTGGVTIEDNEFTTGLVTPTFESFYPRGVIARGTGNLTAMIRRNTFQSGLMIGIQGFDNDSRAVVKCNDFYSQYDLVVTGGSSTLFPTQGELAFGNSQKPAGNEFNNACTLYNDIYYDAINPQLGGLPVLRYIHHFSPGSCIPTCSGPIGAVSLISQPVAKGINSCYPTTPASPSIVIAQSTQMIAELRAQFDNNNTQAYLNLLAEPNIITLQLANQLRNLPAISDELLEAISLRADDFPSINALKKIIVKNYPVPTNLWQTLENAGVTYSELMPNTTSAQNTLRAQLVTRISAEQANLHMAQVENIRNLIDEGAIDEALILATTYENQDAILTGFYQLLITQPQDAQNFLNIALTDGIAANSAIQWAQLLLEMAISGTSWKDADTSVLDQLNTIATSSTIEASYAKAVLDFLEITPNEPYVDPFMPVQVNSVAAENSDIEDVTESNEIREFIIYPNPCEDFLIFESDEFQDETIMIMVYNTSGAVVLKESVNLTPEQTQIRINTQSLSEGSYLLKVDGTVISESVLFYKMKK